MDEPRKIQIHLGDGFLRVEPYVPEELTKRLRYWHRSLDFDWQQMRRVAAGEYREMYQLKAWIDPTTQQYQQQLVTLPGYAHRVKRILTELQLPHELIDERTPLPQPNFALAMEGLRDYQIAGAYTAIASGGGIISAATGYGKGRIMKAIAAAYSHEELCARNTPLIVIASADKDITAKNYDEMTTLLPGREVGLVMTGCRKFVDDVQVITLDSLHHLNPEEVGILLVDEVHTAASDERTESILKMSKAAKWGVSATPTGRFDGRDLVAEGMFGPVIYTASYQDCVKWGALVPIKVYWINCPEPKMGLEKYLRYKSREGRYRKAVHDNETQNLIIADVLRRMAPEHQTLTIMQYLSHMNNLKAVCDADVEIVHAETSTEKIKKDGHQFLHAISAAERRDVYQRMVRMDLRKVLSTYVYKQGVNFPGLDVVIQAGGGGSDIVARQIPGRESRKIADKDVSYLVDFWHPWDTKKDKRDRLVAGPVHADDRAREKAYASLGFDQVWINNINELPFLQNRTEMK